MKNLFLVIELWLQLMSTISLYHESEATMSRVLNKIYNGKSRCITLRYEFIRQLIFDGIIIVFYIRSKDNITNPLIKGFFRDMIKGTLHAMGLRSY